MTDDEQAVLWNDLVGDAWVRHVDAFDATLAPFGDAVIRRLDLGSGDRVLDVGCGVGTTTIDLADRVTPGEVVGVDISTPMLDEARRRAADRSITNLRLIEADVQSADLGTGAFDVAFSRFGVMFFSDPVTAFSNVASSLVPGGRLGFVCFASMTANPFIAVPVLASATHLDLSPPPDSLAPGPFSLADPERVTAVLEAAGFSEVEIEPGPDEAVLHGADDLESLAKRLLEQNPATATRLAVVDGPTRSAAIDAAAEALGEHRDGDVVRLDAGTWIVTARSFH